MADKNPRRYALRDPDLNESIEALIEAAAPPDSSAQDRDIARQLMVSAVRLLRDETPSADLKLVNSALKELRHAFRVFEPWSELRKVAVFGSARTPHDHPDWIAAHRFAEEIVRRGWMVITGAGDGIMGAAQGGAGRDSSFGVNIRLPFEQHPNETIAGDHKLINFRYFFTRKVVFVKESHAIALFPGGFGTHDEGYEALTLIQTGKSEMVPVVFVDAPGGSYWRDWREYVRSHLGARGLISPDDLRLFKVTDSVDEALHEICNFYCNYHSSRFVGDRFVIRLLRPPSAELIAELNEEFSGILTSGKIEASEPLPQEGGEWADLPRLVLRFDRRSVGRMRVLIDRLNDSVAESEPQLAAGRKEIPAEPISDWQRDEEDEEGER